MKVMNRVFFGFNYYWRQNMAENPENYPIMIENRNFSWHTEFPGAFYPTKFSWKRTSSFPALRENKFQTCILHKQPQHFLNLKKVPTVTVIVDDASGKYSSGWFWGNNYWLGSKSLCENIEPNPNGFMANNRSRVVRSANVPSPSQALGYREGPLDQASVPPFSVSFFVLKLDVNDSFSQEDRVLSVGLCLPQVCLDEDVELIMQETSAESDRVAVDVLSIKSSHNRYIMWQDQTFLILW
ncbi:hypothetical protein YQE_02316, partial [Dendroctonus ponderosae]